MSVYAFLYLIANPFPGFAGAAGSYPAAGDRDRPTGASDRWGVPSV